MEDMQSRSQRRADQTKAQGLTRSKVSKFVNLAGVLYAAPESPIWAARGQAIQSYANLEQSLCMAFAQLSRMRLSIAGAIFFKMTASTRNDILSRLVKDRYGVTYELLAIVLERSSHRC